MLEANSGAGHLVRLDMRLQCNEASRHLHLHDLLSSEYAAQGRHAWQRLT
jgi:hypothetical protein